MKKTALISLPVAALIAVAAAACSSDDDSGSSSTHGASPAATAEAQRPADVSAQKLYDSLHAKFPDTDAKVYRGTVTVSLTDTDAKTVVPWLEQATGMPADTAEQISAKDPSNVAYGEWLVSVTPDAKGGAVWKLTSTTPSS